MSDTPMQATPHDALIAQIMDSRVPKTEREWAAAREIERLRSELRRLTDIVERIAVEADGSTPDTSNARALLGDLYPWGGQDDE